KTSAAASNAFRSEEISAPACAKSSSDRAAARPASCSIVTETFSATSFFTDSGMSATRASPEVLSRNTTMFIFSSNYCVGLNEVGITGREYTLEKMRSQFLSALSYSREGPQITQLTPIKETRAEASRLQCASASLVG